MILQDRTSLFILQEDHADLAAQFAAHWGNERFAKLEPKPQVGFLPQSGSTIVELGSDEYVLSGAGLSR